MSSEATSVDSRCSPDPTTDVAREADRIVVSLYGEHDIASLANLSAAMARGISSGDGDVVVDLSGVEFMGADTITVIQRARDFLETRSLRLTVRSPSRCAQRVLDLCGLTGLIEPAAAAAHRRTTGTGAGATWVEVNRSPQVDSPIDRRGGETLSATDPSRWRKARTTTALHLVGLRDSSDPRTSQPSPQHDEQAAHVVTPG